MERIKKQQTKLQDECKPDKQHTVVIGDSILSKLQSWMMSNRANKVKVDPHSGAVVEDLKDYINPILRRKPDNIILHIGTNNLKKDIPNEIADKIVEIAEIIEENLPDCKIAISELITRSESLILGKPEKICKQTPENLL